MSNLGGYFKGWSESDHEYRLVGTISQYEVFKKRAVASSARYVGKHYLRAYVNGLYKGNTDTGRVYRNRGQTIRSGWAESIDFPVLGKAIAKYGTK